MFRMWLFMPNVNLVNFSNQSPHCFSIKIIMAEWTLINIQSSEIGTVIEQYAVSYENVSPANAFTWYEPFYYQLH